MVIYRLDTGISMVHGGGFVVGSAMDIPFNQVRWWTEQGFLVASLEYRLAPQCVPSYRALLRLLIDEFVIPRFPQREHGRDQARFAGRLPVPAHPIGART